jgi:hypothetical protein
MTPYVSCACGCGGPAPIATYSHAAHCWIKGQPKRFINHHHSRVMRKVVQLDPELELELCPCGCGEMHSGFDSRGRPKKYAKKGHALRDPENNYMLRPGSVPGMLGKHHSEETKRKLSVKASVPKPYLRGEKNGMYGRSGERNPRWIDGSSGERQRAYASAEWRALRRIVRGRDGHRCQTCGVEKYGSRELHLHHIKPWAGNPEHRFDPDNIITLCAGCHRSVHAKGGDANE